MTTRVKQNVFSGEDNNGYRLHWWAGSTDFANDHIAMRKPRLPGSVYLKADCGHGSLVLTDLIQSSHHYPMFGLSPKWRGCYAGMHVSWWDAPNGAFVSDKSSARSKPSVAVLFDMQPQSYVRLCFTALGRRGRFGCEPNVTVTVRRHHRA